MTKLHDIYAHHSFALLFPQIFQTNTLREMELEVYHYCE